MGKAHKLADWMPIDANAAVNMTKKQERVLREHTRDELEVIRKLITDKVNRTVPYQYQSEYIAMLWLANTSSVRTIWTWGSQIWSSTQSTSRTRIRYSALSFDCRLNT
jgi:hypothetical protein